MKEKLEQTLTTELEGFLRDLVFQHRFHIIFEVLRRYEFALRFGPKVVPLPSHEVSVEEMAVIERKIEEFLDILGQKYGVENETNISRAFQTFTSTTVPMGRTVGR